jgi:hypothetical protein
MGSRTRARLPPIIRIACAPQAESLRIAAARSVAAILAQALALVFAAAAAAAGLL